MRAIVLVVLHKKNGVEGCGSGLEGRCDHSATRYVEWMPVGPKCCSIHSTNCSGR
jgi:hypothetical protein